MGFIMKKHKIQHIIKKQGGNAQVVFRDGKTVFWSREYVSNIVPGISVLEHKHKNGQTVAFSWGNNLRYVVSQPQSFEDATIFIEKFKWIDRISFNNAVVNALIYNIEPMVFPTITDIAHNMTLLKIKMDNDKKR